MAHWLFIFFMSLAGIPPAQASTEATQVPVRLTLSSWLGEHYLLPGVNLKDTSLRSKHVTFYQVRQAEVVRLDEQRIRLQFADPIEISLFADETGPLLAERRVRSFIVQAAPEQLDQMMQMRQGSYLAMDAQGDRLPEVIEQLALQGRDAVLRDLQRNRLQLPNVQELAFLHLTVFAERLGLREGSPVNHFGLGTLDRFNPTRPTFALNDTNLKALDQVHRIYAVAEASLVEAYLHEMLELMDRREELRARGWLDAIYRADSQVEQDPSRSSMASSSRDGVLRFAPRCQRVFAGS